MAIKIGEKLNRIVVILVSATLGFYFIFSSLHLVNFLTADEHYWIYERIPQYWDALNSGEFQKTYINDKPGVSIALVSGFGYFANYQEMRSGIEQNKNIKSLDPHHDDNLAANLLALRLPLVIFNGLFILVIFWLIRRFTENDWIALWSALLMSLSPILIGISQIINPDALLWSLSAAAIFSYLNLLKSNERKFVVLTAFFVGMSLLTKYVANILFPFFIFLLVYYFITEYGKTISALDAKKYILRQLASYFIIIAGALLTVSILMPAVFVKASYLEKLTLDFSGLTKVLPIIALAVIFLIVDIFAKHKLTIFFQRFVFRKDILFKILLSTLIAVFLILIVGRNINHDWEIFQKVPFDMKDLGDISDKNYPNLAGLFFLEFNPLVFSLTPIVLGLLLALWIRTLFKKSDCDFYIYSISFFILMYYAGSILSGTLATIRYSVILYPLIAFLAGISLWNIFSFFKKFRRWDLFLTILIFILSTASLIKIYPFYFNYTNFLLPKDQIMTDSWGYGGYEAAQYLNSLPNANQMVIWSDFFGVCEFFKGECLTKYNVDFEKTQINYYVLTRRGEIRYKFSHDRARAKKYYSANDPVWQLEIDNRPENSVRVFKALN